MNQVLEAKLAMYDALMDMLNKGQWVAWPNGNQYFVIKPEDFRELMEPYDRLLDAEDDAEKAAQNEQNRECCHGAWGMGHGARIKCIFW